MKIGSLHINDVNNVEVRHEFIINADIEDIVEYNGQKGTLRDIILDVKHRSHPLFTSIEQEREQNNDKVYLLMIPKIQHEA